MEIKYFKALVRNDSSFWLQKDYRFRQEITEKSMNSHGM